MAKMWQLDDSGLRRIEEFLERLAIAFAADGKIFAAFYEWMHDPEPRLALE
jgi:hypothetical protein